LSGRILKGGRQKPVTVIQPRDHGSGNLGRGSGVRRSGYFSQ
jgi:hypothetical protein